MTRTGLPVWFRLRAGALSALVLGATLFCVPLSWAQQPTSPAGSIDGLVRDRSGAVLVGVTVEAVVAGRVIGGTTTGGDGRYRLEVPEGTPFELLARSDGFADHVVSMPGVRGAVTHDVTMQIGALSDTLVVTASRSAEARARVTDVVSVMTAADIAALGSASLADVVRVVPGLNVESTGREGALASLFSRGGESDYNLVLIDGVRVNQSGGAFDFSRIAAGEIERVEIVRGARSALYGSDAMGAVVQVFTKRAAATDAPQVTGALEGGSFNTWRGDVHVGGGARQRLNYHVGVTLRHSDGAFGAILPEEDTFNQAALDAGLGVALGSRASLRTSVRGSRADGRSVGQVVYGVRDTGTAYDTRDLSWHLAVSHSLGSRVTATGTVAYFRSRNLSEDNVSDPTFNVYTILSGRPGAIFPGSPRLVRLIERAEFDALSVNSQELATDQFLAHTFFGIQDFPFRSETRLRRPAFKYQADAVWGNGQRLSAGYEYEHETNPLVPAFEVHNNAVYLQQQFSAGDRWFATIGGRVDDKSRYGTFFSPKLSVGGFVLPFQEGALSSIKVFANVGKGIKNPQFSELFGGSVFFDGNLALKPERARSVDAGVELTLASERVRATVARFDNRYRDLVEYRATGFIADGRPDYVNVAGSKARGWEFEAAMQRPFAGILASASYAFVDSEVTETVSTGLQFQPGQPLLRRPKHSGVIRAAYMAGPVTVNVNAEIRGERHDASFLFLTAVPSGSPAEITVNPGYAVAGLGVDVRVHEAVTIFVRGTNITDTRYESALGYPALPRAFMLGARFTIGER